MSLLPALCGFVYAPFIRLFGLFHPHVCLHTFHGDLSYKQLSFILSGGTVDLLQLHRVFFFSRLGVEALLNTSNRMSVRCTAIHSYK